MDCVPDGKVFNDHIHGNIMIPLLCVKIIDTPQFQRLRLIKQLGAVEFVYYGATHSRFEHSIGTCHLAGVWLKHLIENLPAASGIQITPDKFAVLKLCVMIAGLCHDLGHGPFSHMFDKFYMKQVKVGTEIPHEQLSVSMLRHLIQENGLMDSFNQNGLDESHINMIALMINPKCRNGQGAYSDKKWTFLYEIVNNTETGVDVDKWDYFARDCLHVNITNTFDYIRLMNFSRVLKDESGCSHICFRDKESENLYKMFELRYDLHRQVYSHKVTHTIHMMLADALVRAGPHLHLIIPGVDRRFKTASRMTEDMKEFSRLTDIVIWQIAFSTSTELEASRQIVSDIMSRRFYPSFRTCPGAKRPDNEIKIKERLFGLSNEVLLEKKQAILTEDDKKDILVSVIKLDFAKDEEDPIDSINFYKKRNKDTLIKLQQHMKLRLPPREFSQHIVTMCWKNYRHAQAQNKAKVDGLREGFKKWCEKAGYMLNE